MPNQNKETPSEASVVAAVSIMAAVALASMVGMILL